MNTQTTTTATVTRIDTFKNQSVKNIILIASGKGGVGKTWFSITLAHALAALKKKVLIFDGDLGLANIDIQLGLSPDYDLGDVIEGEIDFKGAISHYKEGRFDILPGRSGSARLSDLSPTRLALVREELKSVAKDYDWVLIDLGAGIGGIVKSLTPASGKCLLIVNDEPTSITDAYAFLKLTRRSHPHLPVEILINQAENDPQGHRTYEGFAYVCEKFLNYKPELAGVIHRDAHIKDAIRHQVALSIRHPNSTALRDVEKIVKKSFK
ncbi:MAG: MinD/ParA family protein [Alphaproteobacteria bacterium]|nr:MinD/ParA family protein [Alphaproteobacteria bacterium]NCQ66732.1 MinD/ParA family protein [Alphaproteobacteria bacterium]NCT07183.1 MinD/ParA family protein [Alphaproteobacteria bacterium]